MNSMTVICRLISDLSGVPPEQLSLESNLLNDADIDSLDMVELLMDIEDHYSIELYDDEITDVITVGDLVRCVDAKL